MKLDITVTSPIHRSPRVLQVAGMFDVPVEEKTSLTWSADLPLDARDWNVGLITGPSGSGKTTLAKHLWPGKLTESTSWSSDRALIDDFPTHMSIRDVTNLLNAVGLASPPAWLRPFGTLSNGEAFRASIARALAESDELTVVDEFTSVVDRQVAKVASHCVAKAVRKSERRFVGVTCHYDVIDWLQPDWIYDVAAQRFTWRSVQSHPPVKLDIYPASRNIWPVFARHHYLSSDLHSSARCFAAFVEGQPVAFTSYMHFPHAKAKDIKRAHRIVVLPDWQGLGIAGVLSEWVGEYLTQQGNRYMITTSHPAFIATMARSPRWKMHPMHKSIARTKLHTATGSKISLRARGLDPRHLTTRTFEYMPARKTVVTA